MGGRRYIAHTNATITDLLLNKGAVAFASQVTPCGSTALTLAAKAGCALVVALLPERDKKCYVLPERDKKCYEYTSGLHQNGEGYTPLHWAARNGRTAVDGRSW
ncbi:hypothetical protein EV426DRAFT_578245 [Tirmania nivea]|nr:hypothetical protein EV426DRAFT_578245 [Tirmania nivea]